MDTYLAEQDGRRLHNDRAITGWPLPFLADLDRRGARGLLADLAIMGALARQAAYVVAIDVDLDRPEEFLDRLNVRTAGATGVGEALRSRHARDLIAATYAFEPSDVPNGFLRALLRIREKGSDRPGFDALAHCEDYKRLFKIFTAEQHSRKADALRFCGPVRSSFIHAAEHLDPVLVQPETIAIMGSPAQVARANGLLELIRRTVSTITDEEITRTLRASRKHINVLEKLARKLLERADRLPLPPLPSCEGLRPLRTAAEVKEFGNRMENCSADKLAEIALGLMCLYEARHVLGDGTVLSLAVTLTPLTHGGWVVEDVTMKGNQRPPAHVLRAVLARLQDLGAAVSGPSLGTPFRRDVATLLGMPRWGAIDDCLRSGSDLEGEVDAMEALVAVIGEAA